MPPKRTLVKRFLCHYNSRMELPKKTGRPPKPADAKLHRMTVFVPLSVKEKIIQHGQEWMRAALKRAKPPKE